MIMVDSTKEWAWPLDLLIFLFNVQIGLLDPRVPQKSPGGILQGGVLRSPSLQTAPAFHAGHAFGTLSFFDLELECAL